ncbi:hypothetical protein FHY19_002600 [Xanthomonas arboricola]|nr:hypothetical protein [Xanthomonas sp. 4461]
MAVAVRQRAMRSARCVLVQVNGIADVAAKR